MKITEQLRRAGIATTGCLALGGFDVHAQVLTTLEENGRSGRRVDIVILAEGYAASDEAEFLSHAETLTGFLFDDARIFENRPFPDYRNFFNVHALFIESADSGVSNEKLSLDTALGATSDVGRRISIDEALADDYIDQLDFEADMIFVAVNTNQPDERSGGADGRYAIYNADYDGQDGHIANTALHEMGHAFAGLGDEYTTSSGVYPPPAFGIFDPGNPIQVDADDVSCGGPEYDNPHRESFPEEYPNLARRSDLVPWAHWVGFPSSPFTGSVNAFEGGAISYTSGVFRPSSDSKMRESNRPFDAIAIEEILLRMYAESGLLDYHTLTGFDLEDVWVLDTQPIDDARNDYTWRVDGMELSEDGPSLSLCTLGLSNGEHTVDLTVIDDTGYLIPRPSMFFNSSFAKNYSTLAPPHLCISDHTRKTDILDREVTLTWTIELTQNPVNGTAQADELSTDSFSKAICGLGGNDTLVGSSSADSLFGGDDADRLVGRAGPDQLHGGPGADVFVLESASDSPTTSPDIIWDFDLAGGDQFDLSGAFGGPFLGNLVPVGVSEGYRFVGNRPFSGNGKELVVIPQAIGSFALIGDIDADQTTDFMIVVSGKRYQTIDNSAFVTRRRK